eukprot:scaffold27021_cov160-Isochrysis_galbana.AAC.1
MVFRRRASPPVLGSCAVSPGEAPSVERLHPNGRLLCLSSNAAFSSADSITGVLAEGGTRAVPAATGSE